MPVVLTPVVRDLSAKSKARTDLIRISPEFNRKSDDWANLGFFRYRI